MTVRSCLELICVRRHRFFFPNLGELERRTAKRLSSVLRESVVRAFQEGAAPPRI